MPTVTAEIEVNLSSFSNEELKQEMWLRDIQEQDTDSVKELVQTMYEKYRLNQPIDAELRQFFYDYLGRIA